jgi:ferrous iron transport protein A
MADPEETRLKLSTPNPAMKVPSCGLPLHYSCRPYLLLIVTATLADLLPGEDGVLAGLDLPAEDADRLMALGFIPGVRVTVARTAPGGDPVVFRVDGAEVALRRETARRMPLHPRPA